MEEIWKFITSPLGVFLASTFVGSVVFIWKIHTNTTLAKQAIETHQRICDKERLEIHELVKEVNSNLSILTESQYELNATMKMHVAVGEERSRNYERRLGVIETKINNGEKGQIRI